VVLLITSLLGAACRQLADASTGTDQHRTLVLIADEATRQTHSRYLAAVAALGSEVDVRLSSDPKLQLRYWDDLIYETVILLHPEARGWYQQESAMAIIRNGSGDAVRLPSSAAPATMSHCISL
jgi:hypothetical protein